MSVELLWLVIAIAAVVVAIAAVAIAVALWRVAEDARQAARETRALVGTLETELPPTLDALRTAADELHVLATASTERLEVVERTAEEAGATMAAIREVSGSVNEILRGPADTVLGVRRSARMVGGTLASGADRLRRALTGDPARDEGRDDPWDEPGP
jgi:uncharacterized protein YoxC